MSTLTTKQRKAIPKEEFGLPGQRAYPMPDKVHAANAKARATQQVAAGNLTPSQKAQIDAKANKVLGSSGGGKDKPKAKKPAHKKPAADQRTRVQKKLVKMIGGGGGGY